VPRGENIVVKGCFVLVLSNLNFLRFLFQKSFGISVKFVEMQEKMYALHLV
jgi:hypothetical protein